MQWIWRTMGWLARFWRLTSLPTATPETSQETYRPNAKQIEALNRALAEATGGRDRLRELAAARRAGLAKLEEALAQADETDGAELALRHEAVRVELAQLEENLAAAEAQVALVRAEREASLANPS
jgi:hypothetical protein